MNEKNLRKLQSTSEARELGAKGGKASGEARRRKKTAREFAEAALNAEVTDKKSGKKVVVKDAIVQQLVAKAIQDNDLATIKYLFELINESPAQKVEVTGKGGERLLGEEKPMSRKEAAEFIRKLQEGK